MTNVPPSTPGNETNSANTLTVTDAWCLLIGLGLGIGFGTLIHNAAVGLGTSLAVAVASNMARRKGNPNWTRWLGLYAVLVVIADLLKLAGVLK